MIIVNGVNGYRVPKRIGQRRLAVSCRFLNSSVEIAGGVLFLFCLYAMGQYPLMRPMIDRHYPGRHCLMLLVVV